MRVDQAKKGAALQNLDDAKAAAAAMMAQQEEQADMPAQAPQQGNQETPAAVPEQQPNAMQEEQAAQGQMPQKEPAAPAADQNAVRLEQTMKLAEAAVQAAKQKDQELQQAVQQLQALQQQNDQLQKLLEETSQKQQEAMEKEIMQPPVLDLASLVYYDEETAAQKQAEYAAQMAKYASDSILKEIQPYIAEVQKAKDEKERNSVIEALSGLPQLPGFQELLPRMEHLIANSELLQNTKNLNEKYITAYAMAKGVDAVNHPPEELTQEAFMNRYKNDRELQRLIDQERASQMENNQQVPPMSASSGAANAALNIPSKPKTLDEARTQAMKLFGL